MAVLPTYDVRIGWGAVAANAFTFGVSTLGEGDVLGSQLYTDFGGAYDDVTTMLQGFRVTRGRDDYLSGMPMSECILRLVDVDGMFNPRNSASPVFGQVNAMRPVRITASYGGVSYGVFRGFVRTIEFDHESRITTVSAGDLFLWMSRVFPTIPATVTTTGGAILMVLDAVGLTEAALRNVDPGAGDPVTFAADGSQSALALVEDLLVAERGVFFADGFGAATYMDRTDVQGRGVSSRTISAPMSLVPNVEIERIKNRVSVTAGSGVPQVAYDPDSQALYGWSDIPAIQSDYLVDDAQARHLANYLVSAYRNAGSSVRALRLVNDSAVNVGHMLGSALQDRVTLVDPVVGSGDYIVEGVSLTLDGVVLTWDASLTDVLSVPRAFTFGVSTLSGSDVLGY